jgi:hypothetical protein
MSWSGAKGRGTSKTPNIYRTSETSWILAVVSVSIGGYKTILEVQDSIHVPVADSLNPSCCTAFSSNTTPCLLDHQLVSSRAFRQYFSCCAQVASLYDLQTS